MLQAVISSFSIHEYNDYLNSFVCPLLNSVALAGECMDDFQFVFQHFVDESGSGQLCHPLEDIGYDYALEV